MFLATIALIAALILPSCSDPPKDGSLRIDINNLATRAPFTELDFTVVRVELFYGTTPPPAPGDDGGDCTFPGATVIATDPVAVTVDLTRTGDSFVGAFFAPPGHISEIRLVSDDTHGVEQGLTRRAHLRTRCSGGDTNGLLRLVPLPGQSIDVASGKTTEVEVQFDPNRDITVDGLGGDYGQIGGPNHPPGSCGPGRPCGKPFKLASTYGVIAFIASTQQVYTDRVVVGFKDGVTQATIDNINNAIGATVIQSDLRTHYFLMQLPPSKSVRDALDYYSGKGEVKFTLPDTVVYLDQVFPCDPNFQNPGPFTQGGGAGDVFAPQAWATTTGSRNVVLAVIDNGFDLANPDMVTQYYLNQGELTGTPGVRFFDTNIDGTVTPAEVQAFDTNMDNRIDFIDLNAPALRCLCAGPPMPAMCGNLTCDTDGDNVVTPLDLVNGNCPNGNCVANMRWQDGNDNDTNQRIDDLVGWDFQNNDNQPQNPGGAPNAGCGGSHGVGVAGIMAAIGAPPPVMPMTCASGLTAGMNWNTRIVPIQNGFALITGAQNASSRATGYIGIRYAAALTADVVNCSWGVYFMQGSAVCGQTIGGLGSKFGPLQTAIQQEEQGMNLGRTLVVVAAGNCIQNTDNIGTIRWPASNVGNPNFIHVGGVNTGTNTLATFAGCGSSCGSSFGPNTVSIAAPATNFTMLNSTNAGGGVSTACQGTSFAAPMVSGAVGLILAANPGIQGNANTVLSRLNCNATNVPGLNGQIAGNNGTSGRLLNVNASVTNANGCP